MYISLCGFKLEFIIRTILGVNLEVYLKVHDVYHKTTISLEAFEKNDVGYTDKLILEAMFSSGTTKIMIQEAYGN